MKQTTLLFLMLTGSVLSAQAASSTIVNWGADFGSGFMRGNIAFSPECKR